LQTIRVEKKNFPVIRVMLGVGVGVGMGMGVGMGVGVVMGVKSIT
jgi:hypothetical protein